MNRKTGSKPTQLTHVQVRRRKTKRDLLLLCKLLRMNKILPGVMSDIKKRMKLQSFQ
jgi:hypothetical protein